MSTRRPRPRTFDQYVPLRPTADRISELVGKGATYRSIAAAAGLTPSGVWGVTRPGQTRVQKRTADLIARVTFADCVTAAVGMVPSVGSIRRIRALMAIGWRHEDLRAHCGINTHVLASQRGDMVEKVTHDAIRAAYDALWNRPGPSSRTRRIAERQGFAPPLSWDDDTIDDPAAQPWTDSAPRGAHIPGQGAANVDSLTDLAGWGYTLGEAAERLRLTRDAVDRAVRRLPEPHRTELQERFHRNGIAKGEAA